MKLNQKIIFIMLSFTILLGLIFLLKTQFARDYVCKIEPGDFCALGLLKFWIMWIVLTVAFSIYVFINKKQLK